MRFSRPAANQETNVDLTPLIDVVFLLLIFFMISTTFRAESKIVVDLPKADQQSEQPSDAQVVLSLDKNGLIEYEGSIIALEDLRGMLEAITEGDKEQPIVLRADQAVEHGKVVAVIDQAKQGGFSKISIATRKGNDNSN